jgi:Spy/CpxP family protein refolding chaperone
MLAGVGFAHGIAFCPGANLTDSVREQFEDARADNDNAAMKTLREQYCPAPDFPPVGFGPGSPDARHGGFCPGANLTEDVKAQFEGARADNDTATLKSLREEYCPAPDKPDASIIRGAKAHANSMINRIMESMDSGDYAGAKDLLENLRTLIRAIPPRTGPQGFGGPMAPPPGGFAANASVES